MKVICTRNNAEFEFVRMEGEDYVLADPETGKEKIINAKAYKRFYKEVEEPEDPVVDEEVEEETESEDVEDEEEVEEAEEEETPKEEPKPKKLLQKKRKQLLRLKNLNLKKSRSQKHLVKFLL